MPGPAETSLSSPDDPPGSSPAPLSSGDVRLPPASRLAASLASCALLLAVAGCGADESADALDGSSSGSSSMDMSAMDEPDATPAYDVAGPGSTVASGDFALLDTAPPGSDDVAGQAWLAQADGATTVTIELTGLEPGREYVSHLHAEECAVDDGGPHFAFDEDGADTPPNEVHLGFTASEDGSGTATVTNDREVGDGAPAIVVHPADAMDNRLVCADFS